MELETDEGNEQLIAFGESDHINAEYESLKQHVAPLVRAPKDQPIKRVGDQARQTTAKQFGKVRWRELPRNLLIVNIQVIPILPI